EEPEVGLKPKLPSLPRTAIFKEEVGPFYALRVGPSYALSSIYRCFKCGSSRNQLDLYAAVTGLGVFEATIALCEQLHREIPWMLNGTSAQARTASRFAPDQPCSHEVVGSPAGELP